MTPDLPLAGLSVLVLEDDYYLADDARRILERAGARAVGPFSAAAEALTEARAQAPDCALVDINLGGGPNFEPARALLKEQIPVVFVTGYGLGLIPPDLAHAPCVQKPASDRAVLAAVAAALGRAGRGG